MTAVRTPFTDELAERERQLRERRKQGIGGSDAAAVLGVDPYKTPLDIYRQKVGEAEPPVPNAAMKRGTILEPTAVQLYAEATGRTVRRQPQRAHKVFPFVIGNVDRQIVATETGPGVLEMKCPGVRVFSKVKRQGLPPHYIVQIQHYLAVYGYAWGSFALFSAELWELIHFDVQADTDFQETLLDAERRFWTEHVARQVPPEERATAPVVELPTVEYDAQIVTRADPEWERAVKSLKDARVLKETAEDLEAAAKDQVKELLGGYGVAEGAGVRVYFAQRDGRKTFDKKALEKAQPLDRGLVFKTLAETAEKRGIPSVDIVFLAERLKNTGLDLALFDKLGKPYDEFRFYHLTAEDSDE